MNIDQLYNEPAVFSECRKYRYSLTRDLGQPGPPCMFIMLNPSTADETVLDPTIRRCRNFAVRWGFGRLIIANLFAYRATKPQDMKAAQFPIDLADGEFSNDYAVALLSLHTKLERGKVVCAWGAHGSYLKRDAQVKNWFRGGICNMELHYLKLTQGGHPSHPLYLGWTYERQARI